MTASQSATCSSRASGPQPLQGLAQGQRLLGGGGGIGQFIIPKVSD